jgi:hypothetical protein
MCGDFIGCLVGWLVSWVHDDGLHPTIRSTSIQVDQVSNLDPTSRTRTTVQLDGLQQFIHFQIHPFDNKKECKFYSKGTLWTHQEPIPTRLNIRGNNNKKRDNAIKLSIYNRVFDGNCSMRTRLMREFLLLEIMKVVRWSSDFFVVDAWTEVKDGWPLLNDSCIDWKKDEREESWMDGCWMKFELPCCCSCLMRSKMVGMTMPSWILVGTGSNLVVVA